MKIKEVNGLNIMIDKKLELMLAIQAVYLKKHPEFKEELDFIEIPPILYLEELEKLIDSKEHQYLINAFLEFKNESTFVEIALMINDNYEFDSDKYNQNYIEKYLGNINLNDFVKNFKIFAEEIKWNDFFNEHKNFYQELFSTFCSFPENLNMKDIEEFYGKKSTSYNYIPSILMNGGFGIKDKIGNLYYIRGIQWWEKAKKFYYDKEYLLECLFHEFSHPFINPLIDNNLSSFTNLNEIYEDALNHNLPKTYSGINYILLYEYFVRANAHILTKKYYPNNEIDDWILQHGFTYLNDIINYTTQNMIKYDKYEDFFINEMIYFMNNILYGTNIDKDLQLK